MDVEKDQIVEVIGNIGKWQWLIILPLAIREVFASMQMLSPSFLAKEPDDYFCNENGTQRFDNLTNWQSFANPILEDGVIDKCNVYDVDYATIDISDKPAIGTNTRKCQSWIYVGYNDTLISNFDLVCSRSSLMTVSKVVYMFGVACGVSISGGLSDYFGRRRCIISSMIILCVSSIVTAFSPNMECFILLRAIIAGSAAAVYTLSYSYCMEIVGGNWKTWLGIGLQFPWATGYSVLPWIAYAIPSWWKLQLVISAPLPIFLVMYFFIPESPRWLLAKGKINEAKLILEKAARINGHSWPEQSNIQSFNNLKNDANDLEQENAEQTVERSFNFFDLFKTSNLRKNTLIQYFNWFTTALVYYGLTFGVDNLIPGNMYLNFSVSGLIEFPAYLFCLVVIHYLGRKIPLALMFLSSFMFLLLSLAIDGDQKPYVMLTVMTLGKFGIDGVFAIIYLHAAELFPTVLRTTGMGSASTFARIGAMLGPVIGGEYSKTNPQAAIMSMAILSMIAGVLTFWLPETKGLKMADTIEEAEAIGKNEKCCKWISRPTNQRVPTSSTTNDD